MKVLLEICVFWTFASFVFGQSCVPKLEGEMATSGGVIVDDTSASNGKYLGGITTKAPVVFSQVDFGTPGQQLFVMRVSLDVEWGSTAWYYLTIDGEDNEVGMVVIGTTGGENHWFTIVTFFEYYPTGKHDLYLNCVTDYVGGNCPNIDYISFLVSVSL